MKSWNRLELADVLSRCFPFIRNHPGRYTRGIKEDDSLVTPVDTDVEALLYSTLAPEEEDDVSFIGEETILHEGTEYANRAIRGTTWVVDPIDGTSSFVHRLPLWGISIGFMQHNVIREGAIALPEMDTVIASDGPISFAATNILAPSDQWQWRRLIPQPDKWSNAGLIMLGQNFTKLERLPLKNPVLSPGSAVQALSWLALGYAIAYIGCMKLWDIAGILPTLQNLGIHCTFPDNSEVTTDITSGAFNLDISSYHCWYLRDSFMAATPAVTAQLLGYVK